MSPSSLYILCTEVCECVNDQGQALNITAAESKGPAANIYFSVPAFVVLFRESLEVVIAPWRGPRFLR